MKGVSCLGTRGLPPASVELLNELFTDSILQSEQANGSGGLEPVEKNSYVHYCLCAGNLHPYLPHRYPASYFLPHNLSEPVSKERVYQYLR